MQQRQFDDYAANPAVPCDKKPSESKPFHGKRKHRHVKLFTLWNLFAIIGIISVVIQLLRYVIIPFLVLLNSVLGGQL